MANQPLYSPINPHFFQPLLPGFTNHLDIPVAFFLKHLVGSTEGKTAELRSDASETTWRVKVDGRRLSDGWEDFTVAHDLRVGDIVVFRHEGELVFHVSPLGPSCCEIQYGEHNPEDVLKEKLCDTEKVSRKKNSLKREADSAPDHSLDSCFVITITASNLKHDTVYIPKEFALSNRLMNKFQIVLMNEEGESCTIHLRHEAYNSGRFNMRRGWRSFCVANGKKPGDLLAFKLVQNEETPVLQLFPMDSEDLEKLQNVPRKKSRKIEAEANDTRQRKCLQATKKEFLGTEATEKEFLGTEATEKEFLDVEVYRNDVSFKVSEKESLPFAKPINEDIRKGQCSQAIKQEYVSTEENNSTSENLFVTLILTPSSKLNLPLEFTKGNGINKAGKIMMLDRYGAKWSTSLLMDKRGTMSLGRGSIGFCEVNGVKMDESFVLELIWEDTIPILKYCSKV